MKQILIIEDDADQRRLFKIALEEAGYEVLEASDGEKGLRLYQQQPCELIITDIFMPEKDGIEIILELKRQTVGVKIIAISGGGHRGSYAGRSGSETFLEVARDMGADRTLDKPITLEQLLATVEELLKTI